MVDAGAAASRPEVETLSPARHAERMAGLWPDRRGDGPDNPYTPAKDSKNSGVGLTPDGQGVGGTRALRSGSIQAAFDLS
jgi:hypothetical protein